MSLQHCMRVPPRSRKNLRNVATQLLMHCEISGPPVPIVEILEFHLTDLGVTYEYVPREDMGDDHGRSFPDDGRIQIREDVYERACEGRGRDRFTIAHEIGHVILHGGLPLRRSVVCPDSIRTFESSEWQANAFAGELLMPLPWVLARCQGPPDLAATFVVSDKAAVTQWVALGREGVLRGAPKRGADRGVSSIRRT